MNEIAIVIISSKIADDFAIICTICLVYRYITRHVRK